MFLVFMFAVSGFLRGPQPGRAQSLGLEEDQSGREGREGPQEVHLRDPKQGSSPDEYAQFRPHSVQ